MVVTNKDMESAIKVLSENSSLLRCGMASQKAEDFANDVARAIASAREKAFEQAAMWHDEQANYFKTLSANVAGDSADAIIARGTRALIERVHRESATCVRAISEREVEP